MSLTLHSKRQPVRASSAAYLKRGKRERSIVIGLLATIFIHALIFWLAPRLPIEALVGSHSNLDLIRPKADKGFDIELAPPEPEKANPMKFVETNPDAPENEPDKTSNFSNRNQQSAQQEAAKELDPENRPSIKGQDQIKNESAIVSGDQANPQQGASVTPSASQSEEQQQEERTARAEQIPLSGFEKLEGQTEEGIGSNISQSKAPSTHAPNLVEGSKESKNAEGGLTASEHQTSRPQPRPRPRLTQARPTILSNRVQGTSNVGILGMDARWSEYGDYLQELIEIVSLEWHSIVDNRATHPHSGSHVEVTFKINAAGEVVVTKIEDTAGLIAVQDAKAGITNRSPYRKWTQQMIDVLGNEQELTFGFYYQ